MHACIVLVKADLLGDGAHDELIARLLLLQRDDCAAAMRLRLLLGLRRVRPLFCHAS